MDRQKKNWFVRSGIVLPHGSVLGVLLIVLCMGTLGYAQQDVYWNGSASDGNWDANGHWWYTGWGSAQWRPDHPDKSTANYIHFDNQNQSVMNLNGADWYQANQLIFNDGTSARTINRDGNAGIDMKGSTPKIQNFDSDGQVFNVPIAIHAATEINPVDGNLSMNGDIYNNGHDIRVYGDNGNTLVLDGNVQGAGKLKIEQNSTVYVTGNSTYSGDTEINAGKLEIGADGDVSGSSKIYLGNGINGNSVALEMQGDGVDIDRAMQVNSGGGTRTISSTAGSGGTTYSGAIDMNNQLYLTADSGSSLTMSGGIDMNNEGNNDLIVSGANDVNLAGTLTAATGSSSIEKYGSGTTTLSGDNSGQSFQVNIHEGTVSISDANQLGIGYSDKLNFAADGTLKVTDDVTHNTLGMKIANGVEARFDVTAGKTFTVGGVITDDGNVGSMVKLGGGTMVVSGANEVDGGITVNDGVLRVAEGASVGEVTVANGGTVSGSGSIGTAVIGDGALIAPGNSPGTMNVVNTTWAGGGGYLWEINDTTGTAGQDPGWDLVDASGTINITATSGDRFDIFITSLSLSNFDTQSDYTWTIATAGSITGFDAGKFNLNLSGFSNPNSRQWAIQQTGNDIELVYTGGDPVSGSSVPEPASAALFALSGVVVFMLRRKLVG